MYIEKYHYNLEYDIVNFYSQFKPGVDYEQHWPIITVSGSRLSADAATKFWEDLLGGKKRARPSICIDGGQESVHTSIVRSLGMTGISFSVLSACTSSAYALHQAGLLSQLYNTPVIVAAADNNVESKQIQFHFHSLGALDMNTGIPFDVNSKGFRAGKGQCFYVVSHIPIKPRAKIKDIRFFTQSDERTSVGSLEDIKTNLFSGVDLTDVSWWNAHAPGTPIGDAAEYKLFNDICGATIPISSVKGITGHLLASSYLVELGIALDSVANGYAKGNVGITVPINNDPRIIQCDTLLRTKTFLKFNMGFGGKNVLTVIESLV